MVFGTNKWMRYLTIVFWWIEHEIQKIPNVLFYWGVWRSMQLLVNGGQDSLHGQTGERDFSHNLWPWISPLTCSAITLLICAPTLPITGCRDCHSTDLLRWVIGSAHVLLSLELSRPVFPLWQGPKATLAAPPARITKVCRLRPLSSPDCSVKVALFPVTPNLLPHPPISSC